MAKPSTKDPKRSCGECVACCILPRVDELNKPEWTPCVHLAKDHPGCSIYNERPTPCRAFICSWLAGSFRPEDRPDKIGIMGSRPASDLYAAFPIEIWEVRPGASTTGRGAEIVADLRSRGFTVSIARPEGREIKQPISLTINRRPMP